MSRRPQTPLAGAIFIGIVLISTFPAQAMNDPVTGRWVSRDPLYYWRPALPPSRPSSPWQNCFFPSILITLRLSEIAPPSGSFYHFANDCVQSDDSHDPKLPRLTQKYAQRGPAGPAPCQIRSVGAGATPS